MELADAVDLLSRVRQLKITDRAASVYLLLGRVSIRRKQGEHLSALIVRLAEKAAPYIRELSTDELRLFYSSRGQRETKQ